MTHIEDCKGRVSYKIFANEKVLEESLKKNKDKVCEKMSPVYSVGTYREYAKTEVRRLTEDEIQHYSSERS